MSIKDLSIIGCVSLTIVTILVFLLNIKCKQPIWKVILIIVGGTFALFIPLLGMHFFNI